MKPLRLDVPREIRRPSHDRSGPGFRFRRRSIGSILSDRLLSVSPGRPARAPALRRLFRNSEQLLRRLRRIPCDCLVTRWEIRRRGSWESNRSTGGGACPTYPHPVGPQSGTVPPARQTALLLPPQKPPKMPHSPGTLRPAPPSLEPI